MKTQKTLKRKLYWIAGKITVVCKKDINETIIGKAKESNDTWDEEVGYRLMPFLVWPLPSRIRGQITQLT